MNTKQNSFDKRDFSNLIEIAEKFFGEDSNSF